MITNSRCFVKRNLVLLVLLFTLMLADIFVVETFYDNFIDNIKVFKALQVTLGLSLILANILHLYETKASKKK